MKLISKEMFLEKSGESLDGIYDTLASLPVIGLRSLEPEQTVLVIIDMINGFTREGDMKSGRAESIIPAVAGLAKECDRQGIGILAFADSHTDLSPEFLSYPAHCMAGTSESEVVDEIKDAAEYTLFPKNSTNGFLEKSFQQWISKNGHIRNYIVTGVCTDICIQQFAVTLKAWFNMRNESSRVIVPLDAVETYDLGLHEAGLFNAVTLLSMAGNGVELAAGIEV